MPDFNPFQLNPFDVANPVGAVIKGIGTAAGNPGVRRKVAGGVSNLRDFEGKVGKQVGQAMINDVHGAARTFGNVMDTVDPHGARNFHPLAGIPRAGAGLLEQSLAPHTSNGRGSAPKPTAGQMHGPPVADTYEVMGQHYSSASGRAINPPASVSKPAGSTRTNANGVVQEEHGSGITARSISQMNSDLGIDLKEGFSSVALPNTKDGDVQLNQGSPLNVADSGYTQQEVDVLNSGGSREWNSDMSADDPGTLLTSDGTDVKNTEWGKRGLTEDRWKQRRAFLDAEDSLSGLRAMEAQKGIVYAGQQNYIRDGDKMHEISADDKKTVMRGGDGAQDFLNSYKSKLTESTTPAESQAPPTVEQVSRTFKADAPNIAGGSTDIPQSDATDFDINNNPAGDFNTSYKSKPSKTDWMSTDNSWYS